MRHIPVLLKEVIESLNLKANKNIIDGTLGDAGHAEAILEKIAPQGMVLGIDADAEAVLNAKRNLYRFEDRAVFVRDNFKNIKKIVKENNFSPVDGILLDLGWSTPQFMERGRGFSFELDEPLDMRYDINVMEENKITAKEIVNKYLPDELGEIFRKLGEEGLYKEIAETIVQKRKEKEIVNTFELVEIILAVYRKKLGTDKEIPWVGGIHPATKVFQALRIEVNNELQVLKETLPEAVEMLSSGGRLAVISFHSLEDRIVKHYFQSLPVAQFTTITKKPLIAREDELKNNPRARSAKLRVIQKNF
jgi:16S rRNA (cytosine1402-N4)-methyltransferase